jgi:hypothetical protein
LAGRTECLGLGLAVHGRFRGAEGKSIWEEGGRCRQQLAPATAPEFINALEFAQSDRAFFVGKQLRVVFENRGVAVSPLGLEAITGPIDTL